jgi:hypothetical protein
MKISKMSAPLVSALVILSVLFSGLAGAQAAGPFSGSELEGVRAVITGFLAVGAFVVIAIAIYNLGKKGAPK